MNHKILHRYPKIEQYEHNKKTVMNSGPPEGKAVPALLVVIQ